MKNRLNRLEGNSRKVFHELHHSQAKDDYIFKRLSGLLTTEYLNVDVDFFKGKKCLDAGCGSNANASYSMLKMGANFVYPMDLDDSIFKIASSMLEEFDGKYKLTVGNVLDAPFVDDYFDFTHCAGVLHHTANVEQGIKELVRVTKPGGLIYVETYGKGGLIREITSLLRDKYKSDNEFKLLVDKLTHQDIQKFIEWTFFKMQKNEDKLANLIPIDLINLLFDEDLVLTIKDRMQAPVYHEHSEDNMKEFLENSGIKKIERLNRYPYLKNIRRFLCPVYDEYNSVYAKVLYGDGMIGLKAIKDV